MSLRAQLSVGLPTVGRRFDRRSFKQAWSIAVLCCAATALADARTVSEYTAAEAKKHIGETATVIGKVDCIEYGGTHIDLEMGACLPNTLLMVVVPKDLAGLKKDPGQLRGATIARETISGQ